jgi:hypothetical protein
MPYKSEKQRRWMWANRPDIARKWKKKGHDKVVKKKKLGIRSKLKGD